MTHPFPTRRSADLALASSDTSTSCAGRLMDGDMETPPTMGTATAINFQPTGDGRAAITGDFVLVANEVDPVLRVLRTNGIEVTALHNHMLNDEPRLFFMHFWANDDARSEEHTSELQSLMRTSYAVFCLKNKTNHTPT